MVDNLGTCRHDACGVRGSRGRVITKSCGRACWISGVNGRGMRVHGFSIVAVLYGAL